MITSTSGTTYSWPNLEPMQVAFFSAGEITQVKDAIPWVRCASGNVYIVQYKEIEGKTSAGTELFWQQLKDETVKKKDGRLNK